MSEELPIWYHVHFRLERFDEDLFEWVPEEDERARYDDQWIEDRDILVELSAKLGKETGAKYRVLRVEVEHETTFGGETLCKDHFPAGAFAEPRSANLNQGE